MSARLDLVGLTRVHGAEAALADLTLAVPAGGCLTVLGPSGSGKSTLLRLIAGLEEPTAGSVGIDGQDQRGVPAERRGAVLVSQRPLLFPHLSVLDNVAFAPRLAGGSRRAARAAAADQLEVVGLAGLAHRGVDQVSGGQAQRVALARALAAGPRVLLLDEPFSALDNVLRTGMHELLLRVRELVSPTIVLVTHDHAEAAALGDTVAVLEHGRLQQHALVPELFARPASPEVHRITGGRTEVPGVVRGGVHHSALGALALAADLGVSLPDGPAVLLLRHEVVQVTAAGPGVAGGTIATRLDLGARALLGIELGSGPDRVLVHAEVPAHRPLQVGSTVTVHVPGDARWAVPLR